MPRTYKRKYAVQSKVDPSIVLEEHEGVHPVSYMAYSNLRNISHDSTELLSIMNSEDDLPQWADEMLTLAKNNVSKVLGYVRSEKMETESLKEDHDTEKKLVSKAQQRGFLSSFKEKFNRPRNYGEAKVVETDEKLRSIFLSHGSFNLSLNKDLQLASEAINENNFIRAKKHLTDFNDALAAMSSVAEEFLEIPEDRLADPIEKEAGLFDFFKSKQKPEPTTRNFVVGDLFKEFKTLLGVAEHALEGLKSIFKMLDKYRTDRNVSAYFTMLESLQDEQRLFSEKFENARKDLFLRVEETGQEKMKQTFKEMRTDLFNPKEDKYVGVQSLEPSSKPMDWMYTAPSEFIQPDPYAKDSLITPAMEAALLTTAPKATAIKKTDDCPCGSKLPWLACHGMDTDRVEKIMNEKNVSYEEAERRYYTWVNLYLARQAKMEAEKEAKKEEARQKRMQDYLKFESRVEHMFPQEA